MQVLASNHHVRLSCKRVGREQHRKRHFIRCQVYFKKANVNEPFIRRR
jgi:hypothetical protein